MYVFNLSSSVCVWVEITFRKIIMHIGRCHMPLTQMVLYGKIQFDADAVALLLLMSLARLIKY